MNQVLFLCSANYYRSRFAEHFFNWLADSNGLRWRADSRGLMVGHWGNLGPISRYAVERLRALRIPLHAEPRGPIQLSQEDLVESNLVVAVKEVEHRQMMADLFPAWADRVEYWHIDDIDCAQPEAALPHLENAVRALVERLASAEGPSLASSDGPRDAKKLAEAARHRILHQPHLTQQRIWCECEQGRLSLHGQVPSFYFKQLAQEAVVDMEGVRQVVNEIEVIW
jgi:protein-tyrosine phosphatase